MTTEKCSQCENQGKIGACGVRQTTGGDYVCNFMPKSGSVTFGVSTTMVEKMTKLAKGSTSWFTERLN